MVYDCWPPHQRRGVGWPKTNANYYNFQWQWLIDTGYPWINSHLTFWVLLSPYHQRDAYVETEPAKIFRMKVKCCTVLKIHAKLAILEFKQLGQSNTFQTLSAFSSRIAYLPEKSVELKCQNLSLMGLAVCHNIITIWSFHIQPQKHNFLLRKKRHRPMQTQQWDILYLL